MSHLTLAYVGGLITGILTLPITLLGFHVIGIVTITLTRTREEK